MTKTNQNRDSNLELFRIITMLLIIAHHYVVNSGLTAVDGVIFSAPLSWRSLFLLLLGAWGKTGINCFLMITGYFMCKSNITIKKFLKLLCEVLFYRIIIYSIFVVFGRESLSFNSILLLIPFTHISNNFTTCYLIFFLFIPFANVLIKSISKQQHFRLLLLCGFVYVILGTFHTVSCNYVSWFLVVYLFASYIRLYPTKLFSNTSALCFITILCIITLCASVIFCSWIGIKIGRTDQGFVYHFAVDSNSFIPFMTGLNAFLLFKNIKVRQNKIINTIAASTFGVLCIHANSDAMRQFLWIDLVDAIGHYNDLLMPLYVIAIVITVFISCTVIDQIRISLLERPFFKFLGTHFKSLC